jgi:hypothetical protein
VGVDEEVLQLLRASYAKGLEAVAWPALSNQERAAAGGRVQVGGERVVG